MDYPTYLRFALALVFVLGLIALATWAARRLGLVARAARPRGQARRISIVEVTTLDAKRRLVLVRRDDTEHLLLLGLGNDVVIESDIRVPRAVITPSYDFAETAS